MTTTTTTMTSPAGLTDDPLPAEITESAGPHPETDTDTIISTMYFLPRLPKYLIEKPYTMRYSVPPPASPSGAAPPPPPIPQTNIALEPRTLAFRNLRRAAAGVLSYEKCGFAVVRLEESRMRHEDFADQSLVEGLHGREVAAAVREALGARSAEVLDFVVRRRHPTWPIATGESYEFQQPASRAHIDHTYEAGCQAIRDVYGEKADVIIEGKWQCVNVWHPLRGPLHDWPLALCDASTVDFERDTMPGDVVDRDAVFENTQVHFNPAQEWYYLKDQMPNELLVFKNADSEERDGAMPGVPHASFDNPLKKESDVLRESVEFRVLVLW